MAPLPVAAALSAAGCSPHASRQGTAFANRGGRSGRAIAVLLKNPADHIGKTIPLSGPVEMNHEQMAAELSEALGRKIVFQDLPIDEYCTSIEAVGVPPYVVQHLRGAMADYQGGHMSGGQQRRKADRTQVHDRRGIRSRTCGRSQRESRQPVAPCGPKLTLGENRPFRRTAWPEHI